MFTTQHTQRHADSLHASVLHTVAVVKRDCVLVLHTFTASYMYVTMYYRVPDKKVIVVVLLFYVHGKHIRSCRDGQLT